MKGKSGRKLLVGDCAMAIGVSIAVLLVLNMHKKIVNWYEIPVIAHAGGGIDGKTLTNSLEALNLASKKGYQMIEIDFSITSDRELVCYHGWDEDTIDQLEQEKWYDADDEANLETFLATPICRKYTPMTAEDLIDWMKDHKGIYIITDTKYLKKEDLVFQFGKLAELCKYDAGLLDRFVIQIYDMEMYETIREVYDFNNIIYATYVYEDEDIHYWEQVALDCHKNDIAVVLMSQKYVKEPYVSLLKEYNLIIYTFTVNSISRMEKMMEAGADGVYSDWLTESDLKYINYDS